MSRPGFECARELELYRDTHPDSFPAIELAHDLTRGAERFAAEVALAELCGRAVPSFAHERAFETLLVMAKG